MQTALMNVRFEGNSGHPKVTRPYSRREASFRVPIEEIDTMQPALIYEVPRKS